MSQSFEYTPIPFDQLSKDALQGVIEEFINREGTDYGHLEYSFDQKCEQVLSLIHSGKAQIVFDHQTQSVSIMNRDQL
jgi:uncharacterized protein YheU (UPF0270 family)